MEINLTANSVEEGAIVQLVDDNIHELTESFQISLSLLNDQGIAVQLNPNTATVVIGDDDSECKCGLLIAFLLYLNLSFVHVHGFVLQISHICIR